QDSSVRSAVVIRRNGAGTIPHLAALLVPKSGRDIDASECMGRMRRELPSYMVPQALEEVESIPVLPSGKVDRIGAQSLRGRSLLAERKVEAPRSPAEEMVLQVWQDLFPATPISRTDDFFMDL